MGEISLRIAPREQDLEALIAVHRDLYGREFGFDAEFERHVREPLTLFFLGRGQGERLWIAEEGAQWRGCIAIVRSRTENEAQLRWFLVDPAARVRGLGRRLLRQAIAFARKCGYARIDLWTVDLLLAAARLYRSEGFTLVESVPGSPWGVALNEERYRLELGPGSGA